MNIDFPFHRFSLCLSSMVQVPTSVSMTVFVDANFSDPYSRTIQAESLMMATWNLHFLTSAPGEFMV